MRASKESKQQRVRSGASPSHFQDTEQQNKQPEFPIKGFFFFKDLVYHLMQPEVFTCGKITGMNALCGQGPLCSVGICSSGSWLLLCVLQRRQGGSKGRRKKGREGGVLKREGPGWPSFLPSGQVSPPELPQAAGSWPSFQVM